MENNKKYTYLNIFKIRYPLSAIVSIFHRISGFFLYFSIPLYLNFLSSIMHSFTEKEFIKKLFIDYSVMKFILFLYLLILVFHTISGIRHILMFFNYKILENNGFTSSILVLILFFISTLFIGIIYF